MFEESYPFIRENAFLKVEIDEKGSYTTLIKYDNDEKVFEHKLWCNPVTHDFKTELSSKELEFSLKSWAEGISTLGESAYLVQILTDHFWNSREEELDSEGIIPSCMSMALLRFMYIIDPNIIYNILETISE